MNSPFQDFHATFVATMFAVQRTPRSRGRVVAILAGGLVMGHALGLLVVGIGALTRGQSAMISSLIGMGLAVLFFISGQLIELITVEKASPAALIVTMISYIVRMILLWVLMEGIIGAGAEWLSRSWLAIGLTAGVVGWITGMVLVTTRLRTPVFDTEYQPPAGWKDEV